MLIEIFPYRFEHRGDIRSVEQVEEVLTVRVQHGTESKLYSHTFPSAHQAKVRCTMLANELGGLHMFSRMARHRMRKRNKEKQT